MVSIYLHTALRRAAIFLAGTCVAVFVSACGDVKGKIVAGSNPVPAATTTLKAETSNNTSAADSFLRQTNGNEGAANVSKLPIGSLLPSGSSTKVYVTFMGWFGKPDHMNVGYRSDDPAQVHRQVGDMISRGVQGAIAAWYGPANTVIESSTQLLKSEAEAHSGQFEFAIMIDVGALGSAAKANQCDATDEMISDLTYAASEYESSPAYMRMNGRPVVLFFSVDAYYIDWNRVISSIPGNPLLIFRGNNGLTRKLSDGGFSWVNINSNPFDPGLASQDSFYKAAQQASGRIAIGAAYKGFNDTLAQWGTNRVIQQQCGQPWQQTFSEVGKFFSGTSQLPAIQVATWNDYEEGTAIEPGIDNCIFLAPSQAGTTIHWDVNGGDESTIDHYTVFVSTDGMNLSKLMDVPSGTHTLDLSQWSFAPATYSVYVKATGKPSFQNKMSPPISYHPGEQPSGIQLNVSQSGQLMYTASIASSGGSFARSQIDFGDGIVTSGPSASHTYAAAGTYLITATAYDAAGASAVAVQQISAKSTSSGITILSPANGATVNWPTMLQATANPGTPVSVMRVLIDGSQAYAANGDTLNTALKVFTGTHQITVQSLDGAGNTTGSASINVDAEPGDIPPVANITIKPLPGISARTVLGCVVNSFDADGFIMSQHLQFSDGSQFTTPAAVETFSAPGTYKATATVMDQYGATNSTSTTFSVDGGGAQVTSATPKPSQQEEQTPVQPMRPPW